MCTILSVYIQDEYLVMTEAYYGGGGCGDDGLICTYKAKAFPNFAFVWNGPKKWSDFNHQRQRKMMLKNTQSARLLCDVAWKCLRSLHSNSKLRNKGNIWGDYIDMTINHRDRG